LKAEAGNSINLSLSYLFKPGNATIRPEVMAFYNHINNAIQLAIDPNRPGWGYYFNISESDYITKGYRINLKTSFKDFSISAGMATTGKSTLSDSKNYSYSTDYICNTGYSNQKLGLTFNLHYKYSGNYFDYAGTFDESFTLTGIQEQQFSNYQLMDIVINKSFASQKLLLSTGVKNIFDVSLIDTKGTLNVHGGGENFAMAGYGRSYFLKITYRFEKNEE
jgi:outer membrane receptor for ferrienterochelin and colicins